MEGDHEIGSLRSARAGFLLLDTVFDRDANDAGGADLVRLRSHTAERGFAGIVDAAGEVSKLLVCPARPVTGRLLRRPTGNDVMHRRRADTSQRAVAGLPELPGVLPRKVADRRPLQPLGAVSAYRCTDSDVLAGTGRPVGLPFRHAYADDRVGADEFRLLLEPCERAYAGGVPRLGDNGQLLRDPAWLPAAV